MRIPAKVFVLLLSSFAACDVPFSPKGEFTERAVVYSILDVTRPIQFARVYFTYDIEGLDPGQNAIDRQGQNASVVVYDEIGQSYPFKDTLLRRDTYSRYNTDIVAYSTDRLVPTPGKKYRLEVSIPNHGVTSATVTVPKPFTIYVNDSRVRAVLADSANPCNCIEVTLYGGSGAKGHLTRLFIDYKIKRGGQPAVKSKMEVPLAIQRDAEGASVPIYPQPDRTLLIQYPKEVFQTVLREIQGLGLPGEIEADTATFFCYALEPNLYNYYLLAHGFGDPFSIRLDLPDYTNIQGGTGVFGAVAVDSLTLPIRSQ